MNELEKMNILRLSNEAANRITRECMRKALVKLMAAKEFSKISVTEIVQTAGVSRNAFYRNYETKEALLEDVTSEFRGMLAEFIRNWTASVSDRERLEWMKTLFQKLKENSTEVGWIIDPGKPLLSQEEIEALVTADGYQAQYRNTAVITATLGIMIRWLRSGTKESAEDMSSLCCELISKIRELQPIC